MAPEYLTCPFCGFEFDKNDTLCRHGCPLGATCGLSRCPNCQYEFTKSPPTVTWLQGLFRRKTAADLPDRARSVRDLRRGERAHVLCLGGGTPAKQNTLSVFGLVPGAEIELLQHYPSCVVRVGETELALDTEIARGILVDDPPKRQGKDRS